jgi:hypothetical protein
MQNEVFDSSPSHGWGIEPFPPMGSERTLVLAFGDSAFQGDPAPFAALRCAYPKARLMGCSTAGEILDTHVHDGTLVVAVARFEDTRLETAVASAGLSNRSRETGIALAEHHSAAENVEVALEALPPDARQVGFYSYGEIAPYATGACDLYN